MSHEQVADILMPEGMDYAAMGVAFLVYFVLSFLWWGPLFGKKWAKEMGMEMDPDNRPPMTVPLILQAVGTLLLTYVLWHVAMAFAATHDANGLAMGELSIAHAFVGALMVWLGFYVPVQLGKISWEKGTWTLAAINAGGHLVGLIAMMLVFALM
jgi:hypothetical protein